MELLSPGNLNPQTINTDTLTILKALIPAHRQLAELKGVVKSIPNEKTQYRAV